MADAQPPSDGPAGNSPSLALVAGLLIYGLVALNLVALLPPTVGALCLRGEDEAALPRLFTAPVRDAFFEHYGETYGVSRIEDGGPALAIRLHGMIDPGLLSERIRDGVAVVKALRAQVRPGKAEDGAGSPRLCQDCM